MLLIAAVDVWIAAIGMRPRVVDDATRSCHGGGVVVPKAKRTLGALVPPVLLVQTPARRGRTASERRRYGALSLGGLPHQYTFETLSLARVAADTRSEEITSGT